MAHHYGLVAPWRETNNQDHGTSPYYDAINELILGHTGLASHWDLQESQSYKFKDLTYINSAHQSESKGTN